jgi:hypothetical protein
MWTQHIVFSSKNSEISLKYFCSFLRDNVWSIPLLRFRVWLYYQGQWQNSTEYNCSSISLCKNPLQIISIYVQPHDTVHSRYCTCTLQTWIKTWAVEYARRVFGFILFSRLIISVEVFPMCSVLYKKSKK